MSEPLDEAGWNSLPEEIQQYEVKPRMLANVKNPRVRRLKIAFQTRDARVLEEGDMDLFKRVQELALSEAFQYRSDWLTRGIRPPNDEYRTMPLMDIYRTEMTKYFKDEDNEIEWFTSGDYLVNDRVKRLKELQTNIIPSLLTEYESVKSVISFVNARLQGSMLRQRIFRFLGW